MWVLDVYRLLYPNSTETRTIQNTSKQQAWGEKKIARQKGCASFSEIWCINKSRAHVNTTKTHKQTNTHTNKQLYTDTTVVYTQKMKILAKIRRQSIDWLMHQSQLLFRGLHRLIHCQLGKYGPTAEEREREKKNARKEEAKQKQNHGNWIR